ncbi:MAG TPA: hypothetical protein VK599_01805 [Streptosporangiaceae bacterium]|nr:hypothetical protein [Streptosporangiaceae bacterium]
MADDQLTAPDTVEVEVGKGGRPGGRDGYALVVTHLADEVPNLITPAEAAEILRTAPVTFADWQKEGEQR